MSLSRTMLLALAAVIVAARPVPAARPAEPYETDGREVRWYSLSRPAADNPADQLEHAAALWTEGRRDKAFKQYRVLALAWPGSVEAATAQYMMGRILEDKAQWREAFDAYQVLMDRYPGAFAYEEVLERQFALAKREMNRRRAKFLFLPGFRAPEKAVDLFEQVIRNGPRSAFAPEAQYLIGQAYEKSFDYELAVVAYMTALQRYPASDFAEEAAFGRARTLLAITREQPNDEAALDEAYAAAVLFLNAYPDSDHADTVRGYRDSLFERRAEAAYSVAAYYDRIARKPDAAAAGYEAFLRRFPGSDRADEARERLEALSKSLRETPDHETTEDD